MNRQQRPTRMERESLYSRQSNTSRDPYSYEHIKRMISEDGFLNLHQKNIHQFAAPAEEQDGNADPSRVNGQQNSSVCLNKLMTTLQKYLTRVLILNISGNKIQDIDGLFCASFNQLRLLDASYNRIANISEDITNLQGLKSLKFDGNKLTALPVGIYHLSKLKSLSLKMNRLKVIHSEVKRLRSLVELDLSLNMIERIPVELSQLTELQILNISHNSFAAIPCQLVELSKLQQFSLEWFKYAVPAKPQEICASSAHGSSLMDSLFQLLSLLLKYEMQQCALITFLENFSAQNFDKNFRDNRQRTILHQAAANGDTGVINGLLMDKAELNVLDKDQCTPLCLAIRQENYVSAEVLINGGADVNKGGGIFGSPLHLSIVRLNDSIVQALINKNADLNISDQYGNSPMHLIMNIFSKNPRRCGVILEKLLVNGAKLNIQNDNKWAPVHIAVRKGQESAIKAIIEWNEKVSSRQIQNFRGSKPPQTFDLNQCGGTKSWTCMHLAALSSQYKIIRKLNSAGADIFQRNCDNLLAKHCARGNFIMTKTVQYLQQETLRKKFCQFALDHNRLNVFSHERFARQKVAPSKIDEMLNLIKNQLYYAVPTKLEDYQLLLKLTEALQYQDLTTQIIEYKRADKKPQIHVTLKSPIAQMKSCADSMSDDMSNQDSPVSPRRQQVKDLEDAPFMNSVGSFRSGDALSARDPKESDLNSFREIKITVVKYKRGNKDKTSNKKQYSSPKGEENVDYHVSKTQRPKSMQQAVGGRKCRKIAVASQHKTDLMTELIKFKECLLIDETKSDSEQSSANKLKKFEAFVRLKSLGKQPIFVQLMKSLFATKDFYKIRNPQIQIDLIETISRNGLVDLIDGLVKLRRDNEYRSILDVDVVDQLDQSIVDLGHHYQMLKRRQLATPNVFVQQRTQRQASTNLFQKTNSQADINRQFQNKRTQSKSHLVSSQQMEKSLHSQKQSQDVRAFNPNLNNQAGLIPKPTKSSNKMITSSRISDVIALNRGKSMKNFNHHNKRDPQTIANLNVQDANIRTSRKNDMLSIIQSGLQYDAARTNNLEVLSYKSNEASHPRSTIQYNSKPPKAEKELTQSIGPYMSQPFTNKKSGQNKSSFVRSEDRQSSQGSQVYQSTQTRFVSAAQSLHTNTQRIGSNNIVGGGLRYQKVNNQVQPKRIIESVAPTPKVFNRVVDDQTPASPCSMSPRSGLSLNYVESARNGANFAESARVGMNFADTTRSGQNFVESAHIGPLSQSNFQTYSQYKPKAKTIVQQNSPFVSMNSDGEFDMGDANEVGSVTEVNYQMQYKVSQPKSSKFREAFPPQSTVVQNRTTVSNRQMHAVVQQKSVLNSPRDYANVDERADNNDSVTLKANTRAKKVFWSPQQSTAERKSTFHDNYKSPQISSSSRKPQNNDALKINLKKLDQYKSVQSSGKKQSQSVRPDHVKKPPQSKQASQHDLNQTRKKEQQLAANLQSYKNLNRRIQQQQLLYHSGLASNTHRASARQKKQYPVKQYQFRSPLDGQKSRSRLAPGQALGFVDLPLASRGSDKLYTKNRNMAKIAAGATQQQRQTKTHASTSKLFQDYVSDSAARSEEKDLKESATTMRIVPQSRKTKLGQSGSQYIQKMRPFDMMRIDYSNLRS